jgi:hypothetical protein
MSYLEDLFGPISSSMKICHTTRMELGKHLPLDVASVKPINHLWEKGLCVRDFLGEGPFPAAFPNVTSTLPYIVAIKATAKES